MKQIIKNPKISTPIAFIIIGVLAIVVIFYSVRFKIEPQFLSEPFQQIPVDNPDDVGQVKLKPKLQPEENLEEGCKEVEYNPDIDYNFAGSLDVVIEEPAVEFLEIKKDKQKRLFSLGKFKLNLEPNIVLRIPKLWLYFFSEELSDREDNLYGLEDSYLSKIILKRGEKAREVKLGKSDEHSFLELMDCPLGNIYQVDYETTLIFEVLLEIGCNNFQNGKCFDNKGKPLDYINGADLLVQLRLFAVSAEEFSKDISIPLKFKY